MGVRVIRLGFDFYRRKSKPISLYVYIYNMGGKHEV